MLNRSAPEVRYTLALPLRHISGVLAACRDRAGSETNGLATQYRRHLSAADQHCGSEHRLGIGVDAAPPELGREKDVNLVRWLPYCGRVGDGGCLFDELDELRVRLVDDFPLPSSCAMPRTVTTPSSISRSADDVGPGGPTCHNRVSLGGCSGRHPPRRAAGKDSVGCCPRFPTKAPPLDPEPVRERPQGWGGCAPSLVRNRLEPRFRYTRVPAVTSPSSRQGPG
jgi:hypothetical protein